MKSTVPAVLALVATAQAAVQGFDISHYQSSVNFAAAYSAGARFVIIKVSDHAMARITHEYVTNLCAGNRGHDLPGPLLLIALHGSHQCRPDPRRLPLRPPGRDHGRRAGRLLPRPRRRLVRRRHHPAGHARPRVRGQLNLLGPEHVRHGLVDQVL